MSDTITPNTIANKPKVVEPFVYCPTPLPGVEVFVANQFPSFVREDHPKFIEFMESYYSWLNSQGNVLRETRIAAQNQDIDYAEDEFEEQLFREFLTSIPRGLNINTGTVLKHIKQFYRAKGTEKSFKFLFRLLFNQPVELYYPKVDILRVSDGKWIKNKSIKITNVSGDANDLIGRKIRGTINNSTAFIERVFRADQGATQGYELIFNLSSITGRFIADEPIVTEDDGAPSVSARVSPIPTEMVLLTQGLGYEVDDTFEVAGNFPGTGAMIRVTAVGELGQINSLEMTNYGLGYSEPILNFELNKSSSTQLAKVNLYIGALTDYPGYYLNDDGQLSAAKYLHDGEYYQQFSYVVYASESKNYYEDALKKLVHPLGFKNFSGVRIVQNINAAVKPAQDSLQVRLIVENSSPGLFGALDAHIGQVETDVVLKHDVVRNRHVPGLGASNQSILREKFNYKPFLKHDANIELDFQTSGLPPYFGVAMLDPRGNTPVAAFERLGLSKPIQIEQMFADRTNLMPDAVVYVGNQTDLGEGNQVVRLIEDEPGFVEVTGDSAV